MRQMAWVVLLLGVTCVGARTAWAQAVSADEIVSRMMQHDAQRRAALARYTSERTYQMDYAGPIGERHATMRVRMDFSAPDRKQFMVVSESGSTVFCRQIIRRLLEGEREGALEANRLRSMLSPANDVLKLVGDDTVDGQAAWVIDVTPRAENRFNYRGRVWVSKTDYAVMRIVGSPAKSPNWLMGSSSFDFRYGQSGEFWLPRRSDTVSHLRIGGEIRLAVDYQQYDVVRVDGTSGVFSAAKQGGKSAEVNRVTVSLPR